MKNPVFEEAEQLWTIFEKLENLKAVTIYFQQTRLTWVLVDFIEMANKVIR